MLFKSMVIPRRYAKLATAFLISSLAVKIIAKWFLVARIITAQRIPIRRDSMQVTMTAYFAALGWPDPSSLETRTLRNKGKSVVHEEC